MTHRKLFTLLAVVVIAITATAVAVTGALASSSGTPDALFFVSPTGSNDGPGSSSAPFATLQHALNEAGPGSTITLEPGTYIGSVHTVHDGTPTAPISVIGTDTSAGPYDTILYGKGHVFGIDNSWYDISGFEIDGQHKLEAQVSYPTDPAAFTQFKDEDQGLIESDRDVYIGAHTDGVTGIALSDLLIQGAGGECVRVRDNASDVLIRDSTIRYCGLDADSSIPDDPYHNGEGVYIGTSPKSTGEPDAADDQTHDISVEDDAITTYGTECVDIKENAYDNTVIGNLCSDNLETAAFGGSNLEVRGHDNTVADNTVSWSAGSNIKLAVDPGGYDSSDNMVDGNTLEAAGMGTGSGFSIDDSLAAATICANTIEGSTRGVDQATAAGPCTGAVSSPPTTTTTTVDPPTTTTTDPPTSTTTTTDPTSSTTTTDPSTTTTTDPSGTTPPGGSTVPGQILDLSDWRLTLPLNSAGVADGSDDATEVAQPTLDGFSDPYFHTNAAGTGVTLVAPVDGATTSGSHYPRSELREMDGSQEASWSTTSGTNVMNVTESVDAVPTVKQQVVFAQIHGPSDDVFEAETRYVAGTGYVLYVNHNGNQWGQDLDDGYVLGTPFTLSVVAADGIIDVYFNGVLKVQEAKASAGDYFKAGAYTQSNQCTEAGLSSDCGSGGVDDHSFGQVTIYGLGISHS